MTADNLRDTIIEIIRDARDAWQAADAILAELRKDAVADWWLYENPETGGQMIRPADGRIDPIGWAETPLYAHPPVPPVQSGEVQAIVKWLREQSDMGADYGIASEKGTTRRAAYGGGSFALKRAADEIEAGNVVPLTAHPQPDQGELAKALEKIAAGKERRQYDGTTVVEDHPDAMEIAAAALAAYTASKDNRHAD